MATTSAAVRQLSDGNSQGTVLGRSATDKIGFYGTTSGVARNTQSSGAMVTTIGAVIPAQTASAAGFGASTAAIMTSTFTAVAALQVDMASAQALANNIRTTLVNMGLMSGS